MKTWFTYHMVPEEAGAGDDLALYADLDAERYLRKLRANLACLAHGVPYIVALGEIEAATHADALRELGLGRYAPGRAVCVSVTND